jgi:hypothetical protein
MHLSLKFIVHRGLIRQLLMILKRFWFMGEFNRCHLGGSVSASCGQELGDDGRGAKWLAYAEERGTLWAKLFDVPSKAIAGTKKIDVFPGGSQSSTVGVR